MGVSYPHPILALVLAPTLIPHPGTYDEAYDGASRICGPEGMPVDDFVEAFTELAEHNLDKFGEVEKAYGVQN